MTRISIAGDGINVLGPLPIISGEGRKCDSKYLKQNGQDDQGPKLSLRANTVLGVETGDLEQKESNPVSRRGLTEELSSPRFG